MTPIEKAESALNERINQLKANLRETVAEKPRQFLYQSIVVSLGLNEALTVYLSMIGQFARVRYSSIKDSNAALIEQHADLMKSGRGLLEELKANPQDHLLLKRIESAQQQMAAIQKELRRGANALQRELTPSMGAVEKIALSVKRFAEADQRDLLKRSVGEIVENVRELYLTQPDLPGRLIIDESDWEKSVASEIAESTDFYEAYARAGFRALVALGILSMAVSRNPPATADEALSRATEIVAAQLKTITDRLAKSSD
jgi:hypothetical protein